MSAGAPFLHDRSSTASTMWRVSLALLPAGAWGCWSFGLHAALVLLVAIACAVAAEWGIALALRRRTVGDGSAFLTGLLVGMLLPSGVPLYLPAVASLFAIAVVKWSFGGLGNNWMNPAAAGVVFVAFSWPSAYARWSLPHLWSSAAAAPPPPIAAHTAERAHGAFAALAGASYPVSPPANGFVAWVADTLHVTVDPHLFDLIVGIDPGSIGDVSTLFLAAGAIYLLRSRIVGLRIPAAFVLSYLALVGLAGLVRHGGVPGDLLFHLFSGGVVLAAFFMLTDPVTSPSTNAGRVIYGAGAGVLAFLIQRFGSPLAAIPLAIMLMNIVVPSLNRALARSRIVRREVTLE